MEVAGIGPSRAARLQWPGMGSSPGLARKDSPPAVARHGQFPGIGPQRQPACGGPAWAVPRDWPAKAARLQWPGMGSSPGLARKGSPPAVARHGSPQDWPVTSSTSAAIPQPRGPSAGSRCQNPGRCSSPSTASACSPDIPGWISSRYSISITTRSIGAYSVVRVQPW